MTVQNPILKVPEKIHSAGARGASIPLEMTMPLRRHLPDDARQLLEESGLEWDVRSGTRHFKITIEGRFIAIFPHAKPASRVKSRAHQNMLANIRRAIRSHQ